MLFAREVIERQARIWPYWTTLGRGPLWVKRRLRFATELRPLHLQERTSTINQGSAREQTAKERLVGPLWRQKFSRLAQPFADGINVKRDASALKVASYFGGSVASPRLWVIRISADRHAYYHLQ
jgi:hypothetical protein